MDQRISFLTLAVADLEASRAFYVDGLGWAEAEYVAGDVSMLRVGERLVLSLWQREAFEAEVGPISMPPGRAGIAPFTISHNVATPGDVDAVLATARAAGADPVRPGASRAWGGYAGYFGDPDGYHWEVAHNPQEIGMSVVP